MIWSPPSVGDVVGCSSSSPSSFSAAVPLSGVTECPPPRHMCVCVPLPPYEFRFTSDQHHREGGVVSGATLWGGPCGAFARYHINISPSRSPSAGPPKSSLEGLPLDLCPHSENLYIRYIIFGSEKGGEFFRPSMRARSRPPGPGSVSWRGYAPSATCGAARPPPVVCRRVVCLELRDTAVGLLASQ